MKLLGRIGVVAFIDDLRQMPYPMTSLGVTIMWPTYPGETVEVHLGLLVHSLHISIDLHPNHLTDYEKAQLQ